MDSLWTEYANLWQIVKNFLNIEFVLGGFHLSWGMILIYSLVVSLLFGALISFFKWYD